MGIGCNVFFGFFFFVEGGGGGGLNDGNAPWDFRNVLQ